MVNHANVLEYKCPCCDAGLIFGEQQQKLQCDSCGNNFDLETIAEYNRIPDQADEQNFVWEDEEVVPFQCPSCGGLIEYDDHTASTFCPYCDNPVVLPQRVSASLTPDAVIPFKKSRQEAQDAFKALCKGKPLLPKDFISENRISQLTGLYVPFWLYSCSGSQDGKYKATRVRRWSDSNYNYTRTDHFLLTRAATADFQWIPMDASSKVSNEIMESIEPYDYSQLTDFNPAYLTGFLSDKYDVESKTGEERIRQRVSQTMDQMIAASCLGYTTVLPMGKNLKITHSKASYVLLPVWILTSKYKDKEYTFAMNAQTGKMTGSFPICPKRSAAWFFGICATVAALVTAVQYLI